MFIRLLFHCFHLSKGIEDAFKTAATEVSLLAGTDEFNATELFGVGEFLPSTVYPSFQMFTIKDSSTTWQQCSITRFHTILMLGLHLQKKRCSRAGRTQHATAHSFSFCWNALYHLSSSTHYCEIKLLVSACNIGVCEEGDLAFNSILVSCRHGQLRAMDELQE